MFIIKCVRVRVRVLEMGDRLRAEIQRRHDDISPVFVFTFCLHTHVILIYTCILIYISSTRVFIVLS